MRLNNPMIIYAISSSMYDPHEAYFLNKADALEALKRIEHIGGEVVEVEVVEHLTEVSTGAN